MTSQLPAAKRRRIVDSNSIGVKEELLDVQTVQTRIYNFQGLAKQRGQYFVTPKLRAHDLTWEIEIYPRGEKESNKTKEYLSVFLICVDAIGDKEVDAAYTIDLGSSGSHIALSEAGRNFSSKNPVWGWNDFAKRSNVISKCLDNDGSLVISIDIQIYGKRSPVWYPKPSEQNLLYGNRLLESGMEADITFKVGGEEQEIFQAHKCVICVQAPVLYELMQNSEDASAEFAIPNVRGPIFKILLEHIYTGVLPKVNNKDSVEVVKSILLGADRFGLTTLKLQIESELVSKCLNTGTAADLLLFADGHSCPLLKEAVMDQCSNNMSEVKASPAWKKVKESSDLLEELLEYYANDKPIAKSNDEYDKMSVRKLREELEARDLDLDGTKTMLVHRLHDHESSTAASRQGEAGDS